MSALKKKSDSYQFPSIEFGNNDSSTASEEKTPGKLDNGSDEKSEAEFNSYEQGLLIGREEAFQEGKTKLSDVTGLLKRATTDMMAHYNTVALESRQTALRLSMEMAGQIVRTIIAQRPEVSEAIFQKALELASSHEWMKIKAHPDDHERISALINKKIHRGENADHCELIAEPFMLKGGCLIETEYGVIDARIEQQLSAISGELNKAFRQNGNLGIHSNRLFEQSRHSLTNSTPIKAFGHVSKVVGLVVEANGPAVQIGTICDIFGNDNADSISAEVLGFREKTVLMMPLEEIRSIGPGSRVVMRQERATVAVGNQLLGRVIDGLGNPMDGLGPLGTKTDYPLYAQPINPLMRQRIRTHLDLGVRAINGLLTVGCGQRMGIFAGSGVGKSVLMGMIARNSAADVNVIALIGERGRELNEFIEKDLGAEGLKKSVVVVATSDHLPLVRVRGAFVATAIAEFFRDRGMTVNLMMDSLTRFAMAQREIGLALGEPPTTKGYTPSVFTMLPKLLERAGTSDHSGTITGLYTVLVEGDDMNEPIADAARSILDGHIVLTRELASQNHYPAIDVTRSISRVMEDITALKHRHNAGRLKELLATYRKAEDLINIGAYVGGSNPRIDRALKKIEQINGYLRQAIDESVTFEDSLQQLENIINQD
jgi:flagellum-specific ATP synthase